MTIDVDYIALIVVAGVAGFWAARSKKKQTLLATPTEPVEPDAQDLVTVAQVYVRELEIWIQEKG